MIENSFAEASVKASARAERRRREAGYGLTARRSASSLARDSRFRSVPAYALALVPAARVRSVPFLRSKLVGSRESDLRDLRRGRSVTKRKFARVEFREATHLT